MIRAVIDTNVFVSAAFWSGTPFRIVNHGIDGRFRIVISEAIIAETRNKLTTKFYASVDEVDDFLAPIVTNAHFSNPDTPLHVVARDPSDNKIIECAVSGNADVIVTGDLDILDLKQYRDIKIITPAPFLKML